MCLLFPWDEKLYVGVWKNPFEIRLESACVFEMMSLHMHIEQQHFHLAHGSWPVVIGIITHPVCEPRSRESSRFLADTVQVGSADHSASTRGNHNRPGARRFHRPGRRRAGWVRGGLSDAGDSGHSASSVVPLFSRSVKKAVMTNGLSISTLRTTSSIFSVTGVVSYRR